MTRTIMRLALPVTAALLLAAGSASAIYIETPLLLNASSREVDVGDTVTFTIEPRNASEASHWATKTVTVRYAYDSAENGEGAGSPDDSVSSSTMVENVLLADLALDEGARATFEWTVPEEVRDHNVDVTVAHGDGEPVAFDHVAVGDAPPQMRMMAGSGPATEPDQGTPEPTEESATDDAGDDAPMNTPAVGAVLAVAAVGALAVALRRK